MSLYVEDQLSGHFKALLEYVKKAEHTQKRNAIPDGQLIPGKASWVRHGAGRGAGGASEHLAPFVQSWCGYSLIPDIIACRAVLELACLAQARATATDSCCAEPCSGMQFLWHSLVFAVHAHPLQVLALLRRLLSCVTLLVAGRGP